MNDFRPAGGSGSGGAPSGAAGGSLTGTYPNPTIATIPSGATATTQSAADASTKVSTTAYVDTGLALKANLAGPTFTGSPVLPTGTTGVTQSATDGSTKLATTAYVDTADALKANLAGPTFTGTVTLPSGTVTSTMLLDGTILNADVSASAAIVRSKLAASATAPSGALAQTFERHGSVISNMTSALTSTNLQMVAIELPAGLVIGHISFMSGSTALSAGSNQWFALYDSSRVQLATTADDTSTAWAAASVKTLAIATIASGASATYTTTTSGLYYLGIMVKATTVPTLEGAANSAAAVPTLAPILNGVSDTGQAGPPAFAHTATALTANNIAAWAYVSA